MAINKLIFVVEMIDDLVRSREKSKVYRVKCHTIMLASEFTQVLCKNKRDFSRMIIL